MSPDTTFVCTDATAPVRLGADPQSERITDLLLGEGFVAESEHEGLVHGVTALDRIEGFVPRASLAVGSSRPTHHVRRIFIRVFQAPDLLTAVATVLPMNALVDLTGRSAAVRYPGGGPGSSVVELRTGGWVTEHGVAPDGQFESDLRSVAQSFIGAAYLHGGKTWLGCDGPGFVQTVLAACGRSVPRTREQQLSFFGGQPGSTGQSSAATRQSVLYSGSACGFGFADAQAIVASAATMSVETVPWAADALAFPVILP